MPSNITIGPANSAANPIIFSNANDDDCDAAAITAVIAGITAFAWYQQRDAALDKQEEIENQIFDCFDEDIETYCDVDHPQQVKAIQTALDIPECEITCSPCVQEFELEFGCMDNECLEDYAKSQIQAGKVKAQFKDRQLAKERYVNCVTNRRTHIIRATNLSFVDYSKAYAFFSNASNIQGGLAGLAAQGYSTAVAELSYSLGIFARGSGNSVGGGSFLGGN